MPSDAELIAALRNPKGKWGEDVLFVTAEVAEQAARRLAELTAKPANEQPFDPVAFLREQANEVCDEWVEVLNWAASAMEAEIKLRQQ